MAAVQETGDGTTVAECGTMKYYFKCPSCGNDDGFTLPREEPSGLGFALFLLADSWAAMYADAARRRVQCAKCGYLFRQPALPRTAVATLAAWVIGIILLLGLLIICLIVVPEVADLIPPSQALAVIEQFISEYPRVVLLGVLPLIAAILAILVVCAIASWVSSHRARVELRKEFETKPKRHAETRQETATREHQGQPPASEFTRTST